jgi:hypothetical protein
MAARRRSQRMYVKRTRARGNLRISPQNRRKILREAKLLGLTSDEYMRLMLSLSSTLRENLNLNADLKAKELLRLVENPLFGLVLQWVTSNTLSSMLSQSEDDSTSTPSPSLTPPGPQQQAVAPQPPPPGEPWRYW